MSEEEELRKKVDELTLANNALTRRGARERRTIEQLERRLTQIDKMKHAGEIVNNNLYNELARLTRELATQTARVNELLLNVLPAVIKNELEARGQVASRAYDEATVLFSDFIGFTSFCEKSAAFEVVERLGAYFSAFDEIIATFGLEKLKTVGDGYMCVAGVPTPVTSHAIDGVRAALALVAATAKLNEEFQSLGQAPFGIRIGLHTGPVVGGVIGTRKFAFDIWGDTVNTAARVESHGVINGVTISAATHAYVADLVHCNDLGRVAVKGKSAALQRYHVLGLR